MGETNASGKNRYQCGVDSHKLSDMKLKHSFKGELLEACAAKLKYEQMYVKRFSRLQRRVTSEDEEKLLRDLFPLTLHVESEDHKVDSDSDADEEKDQERKAEALMAANDAQEKRMQYARSTVPPVWYEGRTDMQMHRSLVAGWKPAFTDIHFDADCYDKDNLPEGKGLLDLVRGKRQEYERIDTKRSHPNSRFAGAFNAIVRQKPDQSSNSQADELMVKKLGTGQEDSQWKVTRSDPVGQVTQEYCTHTDPITPPPSPQGAQQPDGFIQICRPDLPRTDQQAELGEALSKNPLPEWYMEAEFDEVTRPPRTKPVQCLVPFMSQDAGKTVFISKEQMAAQVPYADLYAMARLRRARDKFEQWSGMGITPDEIKRRLVGENEDEDEDGQGVAEFLERRNSLGVFLDNADDDDEEEDGEAVLARRRQQRMREHEDATERDSKLRVIEMCQVCNDDFAVTYCAHCTMFLCEKHDVALHQREETKTHMRIRPAPPRSPLDERGFVMPFMFMMIFLTTVFVIIFLFYPSIIKQVAFMLNCSPSVCTDLSTCHSFLLRDTSVDCSTTDYKLPQLTAILFFLVYGAGIPIAGWMILRFHYNDLNTKQVMGRYGFLYAGYRRKRYFWEMLILLRKMLMVFIVVFLSQQERLQTITALWVLTFFAFLTAFLKPYRFGFLNNLENLSLLCLVISCNAFLINLEADGGITETAVAILVLVLNLIVLIKFIVELVRSFMVLLEDTVDQDGDGEVEFEEIVAYVSQKWDEIKCEGCKSTAEWRAGREDERKRKEDQATGERGLYYEWRHGHEPGAEGPEPRPNPRLEWRRKMTEQVEPEQKAEAGDLLTDEKMERWWTVAFGEAKIGAVGKEPEGDSSTPSRGSAAFLADDGR